MKCLNQLSSTKTESSILSPLTNGKHLRYLGRLAVTARILLTFNLNSAAFLVIMLSEILSLRLMMKILLLTS